MFKKSILAYSLIVFITFFSFIAELPSAFSQPLFSIGGGLGYALSNFPDKDILGPAIVIRAVDMPDSEYNRMTPLAWSLYGRVQFHQTAHLLLGGELGYHGIGAFRYRIDNSVTMASDTGFEIGHRNIKIRPIVYLLAFASYYWNNNVYVFTGLGPTWIRTHIKQDGIFSTRDGDLSEVGHTDSHSIDNIEPEATMGIGWQFARHLAIYARYTYIVGSSNSNYDSEDDVLTIPGSSPSLSLLQGGIDILF